MASVTAEYLKHKGNEHFKAQRYQEALTLYTQSLQIDPDNVFVYSNRSLIYSKLNQYAKALQDAQECVKRQPQWAKGYLREAAALQGLDRHSEVITASIAGFKVTDDGKLKKDFVSLWLKSTLVLYKLPDRFELPPGICVLSKEYRNVLGYLFRSLDGEVPLTEQLTEQCLFSCADQIKAALELFGQSSSDAIYEWSRYACQDVYPYTTKPQGKNNLTKSISDRTERFICFLTDSVDPVLYEVLRPILGLMVLVVVGRSNILCEANTGHHSAELMNVNAVKLLECPLLRNIPAYHSMYIGRICALLDSFIGRGYTLADEELAEIRQYYRSLEAAVKDLPESNKDHILAIRILSNVRGNVLFPSTFHPPVVPVQGEMTVEIAEQVVYDKPDEVREFVKRYQQTLEAKITLKMKDVEELLTLSGIFLHLKDRDSALRVFEFGEKSFFTVLGNLLSKNVLRLDQCSAVTVPIRQLVLTQASLLDSPTLFADITIRWKCLFTEFRRLLVENGLGSPLQDIFEWYRQETFTSLDASNQGTESTLTQYLKKEEKLLQAKASMILEHMYGQDSSQVAGLLEEGDVVLEYIFFATTQVNPLLDAFCVVISPDSPAFTVRLNYAAIRRCSSVIRHLLDNLVQRNSDGHTTVNSDVVTRMRVDMCSLMTVLVPDQLTSRLPKNISRVFICSDADIAALPLDSVSFSTILRNMASGFSVTRLFSSRELLRLNKTPSTTSGRCCIIADPNYDMKVSPTSLFSKLLDNMKYLGFGGETCGTLEPLQHSMEEATAIARCLGSVNYPVHIVKGNEANLNNVLKISKPLLLHISSHAISTPLRSIFRSNFWSDLNSSIVLAGFNTYTSKKYESVHTDCGTGQLPALGVYSMHLLGTRLVFLSTCSSAVGDVLTQEAVGSLVEAFQVAGAETVIATLWPIEDNNAAKFCEEFYDRLTVKGTRPSQALQQTKQKMQSNFQSMFFWGSFTCYGLDRPL